MNDADLKHLKAAIADAIPGFPIGAYTESVQQERTSIAPRFRNWPGFAFYIDSEVDLDRFLAFDYRNSDLKYHRSFIPRADRVSNERQLQAWQTIETKAQVADFSEFYGTILDRPETKLAHYFRYQSQEDLPVTRFQQYRDLVSYWAIFGAAPNIAHQLRYGSRRDVHVTRFQQYRDLVSYWQVFSAVPNAALTDVVHRNGGRCLAFMFNSGGSNFDREHMLRQAEDGSFPVGERLVDMATYFGFDGYMFDMEAGNVDPDDKPLMMQMFQQMHARAQKLGQELHLQVYAPAPANFHAIEPEHADYLTTPGVADSWFVDYDWQDHLDTTITTIESEEVDQYRQVYFGIELEGYRDGAGVKTTRSNIFEIMQPHGEGPALGSVALFSLSDETTQRSLEALAEVNGGTLPDDFAVIREAVYAGERKFWSGASGNPAIANDVGVADELGMASYVAARSAITRLPFITRFNTGAGDGFSLEGHQVSDRPWFNLGIQDILPTWQFWSRNPRTQEPTNNGLWADYDLNRAFDGGSSLTISGRPELEEPTEFRLFRTELGLPNHEPSWLSLTFTMETDNSGIQIGLVFTDDLQKTEWVQVDELRSNDGWARDWGYGFGRGAPGDGGWPDDDRWSDGWQTPHRSGTSWRQAVLALSRYGGRTIGAISIAVGTEGSGPYQLTIGELAVSSVNCQLHGPSTPQDLTIEESRVRDDAQSAEVRLTWTFDPEVWYYDVCRRRRSANADDLIWLGRVTADCYYVDRLPRLQSEDSAVIQLVAVAPNGRRTIADSATVTVPFSLDSSV